MPRLMLPWQAAALIAVVCVVVGEGARGIARLYRRRVRRELPGNAGRAISGGAAFFREAGIIFALYGLWQLAGSYSLGRSSDAVAHGAWVWHVERLWHLPNEAAVQRLIIGAPWLVRACNVYYATMHFGALILLLLWLFFRHRDAYPRARFTIAATTAACLVVALVPVAPPRLVNVGMIDVARVYHESVYTSTLTVDQYSAMPSVHVAWAAIVPLVVVRAGRSTWRWLTILHFPLTVFVVVATANHYWADGIVALFLLAMVLAAQYVGDRLRQRVPGTRQKSTAVIRRSPRSADSPATPIVHPTSNRPQRTPAPGRLPLRPFPAGSASDRHTGPRRPEAPARRPDRDFRPD